MNKPDVVELLQSLIQIRTTANKIASNPVGNYSLLAVDDSSLLTLLCELESMKASLEFLKETAVSEFNRRPLLTEMSGHPEKEKSRLRAVKLDCGRLALVVNEELMLFPFDVVQPSMCSHASIRLKLFMHSKGKFDDIITDKALIPPPKNGGSALSALKDVLHGMACAHKRVLAAEAEIEAFNTRLDSHDLLVRCWGSDGHIFLSVGVYTIAVDVDDVISGDYFHGVEELLAGIADSLDSKKLRE